MVKILPGLKIVPEDANHFWAYICPLLDPACTHSQKLPVEIEREWHDQAYREATIVVTARGAETSLDPAVRRRLFTTLESYLQSRDDVPTWQELFREEVGDEIFVNTLSTYLECTPLEKQFLLEADSLHQQARRLSDLIEFMMHDRSGAKGWG